MHLKEDLIYKTLPPQTFLGLYQLYYVENVLFSPAWLLISEKPRW